MEKIRSSFVIVLLVVLHARAGPIEDISTMPDLSLVNATTTKLIDADFSPFQFYQQLIRQPDLQGLLQGAYAGQQTGIQGDFTIFAPNNDAMARLNRRNEDPTLLWKYHIVPGVYTDQAIYNIAQERFSQTTPQQMSGARPQNNLPTMALPFQVKRKHVPNFSSDSFEIRFFTVWDITAALARTSMLDRTRMPAERRGYRKRQLIKVSSTRATIA